MNWTQFKDPVSHMCLAGAVVVSWYLIQEVEGSSPFTVMTNIFVTDFSENVQKKLHCVFHFNVCAVNRTMELEPIE